jgi:gamma-glutamyltranspeptidase/glutathione hydrolase
MCSFLYLSITQERAIQFPKRPEIVRYTRFVHTLNRFAVLIAICLLSGVQAILAANPSAVTGMGGAVASAEADATAAGVEILGRGGNAADAAVATALALAVVHPQAGNLGGGGFAVIRIDGEVATLDFRETAPAAATRDMYIGEDGKPIREASWIGPLAAGVPGSPGGLHALHTRYGALPWAEVVKPAIRLAAEGFVVSERLARDLVTEEELLARFSSSAEVWLPGGNPVEAGQTMTLPQLAATLKSYARVGPAAITEGEVAVAVEAASTQHGGVLTEADLAAYRHEWRNPVLFEAYGWQVASMPLPSSGGIIIGQTLGMLQRVGWSKYPRFGADRFHLLAEALRRTFADRFLLGDPATTMANAGQLLAPDLLDARAKQIRLRRATPSKKVKAWSGPAPEESAETTHLSVVDDDGNAVSITTTLNGWFGCGLFVEGAGFFLNNEMDDFAAAPGKPNTYGLVQGEANAVGPGKRMLSSMSPVVAWRGDEVLVLGSPGGPRIPTATAQVLLNLVVDSDELQAAVNRPRIHHQWLPDALFAEPDALSPETAAALRKRGHEIRPKEAIGKVQAVRLRPDGTFAAAGDPRGPGVGGVGEPGPNEERAHVQNSSDR